MTDFLCSVLKRHKDESNSIYAISSAKGKPVEPRVLQLVYKKLLTAAKVVYRNFHVLRHTCATRLSETGADVKTISEILGHSNAMITLNRYTHSLFEQKKKAMKALNGYFMANKPPKFLSQ
jgi:integrase